MTDSPEIIQRLKRYALYLLGRRAHSTHEMTQKLKLKLQRLHADKRDDDESVVQKVIEYLSQLELLSDISFAREYIRSLRIQKKSARVIRLKLQMKGISRDLIDELLHDEGDTDSAALQQLINQKVRFHPELLQTREGKMKLMRFLVGRGFRYDESNKAIEAIIEK